MTNKGTTMHKRTLLKLASSAALSVGMAVTALPALAQDVTMNLGFGAPEASIYGRFSTLFKEEVEKLSDGAIEVKLRCCNQISTEDEAFRAMQLGTVDGFIITANNVSPHWPLMDVTVLPYIFQDGDHLLRVLDGEVGQEIKDQLQQDTSVHLLAYGPDSTATFTTPCARSTRWPTWTG